MRKPKAVLFDFGDTVLKITGWDPQAGLAAVYALARNPRGVTLEEIATAAERIAELERTTKAATAFEFRLQCFQRLLFDRFGIAFDVSPLELEKVFWKAATEHEVTQGLAVMLDGLAARGIEAAVLSNAVFSGEVLADELVKYGLDDRFVFLMSSADFGVTKPHALLFEAALGRLELAAEDVWFVGDRCETDVAGANGVGMTSVWYTGAIEREKAAEADVVVKEWPALIDAIDAAV